MKRKLLFSILIVVLSFLLLYPASVWTLMVNLSMEDLTQQADSIVLGKVVGGESRYPEKGTIIYTYITLEVIEDIKGDLTGKEITIRYPGGEIGSLGVVVSVAPVFDILDLEGEVLLFLRKPAQKNKEHQYWVVVGSFQGKYNVRKDESTGGRTIISKGKLDSEQYPVGAKIPFAIFKEKIKGLYLGSVPELLEEYWRKEKGDCYLSP